MQVIEGASTIGGGCRTEELTLPGFWHDVCSAGHPLAVASPFFRRFDLAARGVTLAWPEVEFAQPLDGGRAAVVTRSVDDTAARLGADGRAYQRLLGPITDHLDEILQAVLAPLRSVPAHPLAAADYGRRAILPASVVARRWRGQEARAIMAGAAAHAMMPLTAAPTAGIGLMLVALAHGVGWPVVAGGSARITDAMAVRPGRRRRQHRDRPLGSVAGRELPIAGVTLLDVSPRTLVQLAGDRLPGGYRAALRRFRYGPGVCKVDFALSGPVPWTNEDCRRAGTCTCRRPVRARRRGRGRSGRRPAPAAPVRAGGAARSRGSVPRSGRPADAVDLDCHVPAGSDVDMTDRIEAQIERFAPGFRDLILARAVRTAADEEAYNPNYVGGDIGVGLQTIRQTFLRPVARWNPYRTPIRGVYLCSSATPPIPGVHGRWRRARTRPHRSATFSASGTCRTSVPPASVPATIPAPR